MTLITNPIVNSYKRLVPGYDAPVNISWSSSGANRSALIRIPSKRGQDTKVELRNPDSTCNPYLAIALILAAGMDGIETFNAIRNDESNPNSSTPMIMMTANVTSNSHESYLSIGFNDFIGKPVDPILLESMLRRLL